MKRGVLELDNQSVSRPKKVRSEKVRTWLNLGDFFYRDIRLLIYSRLSTLDRLLVELAHGVQRRFYVINGEKKSIPDVVCHLAASFGHTNILKWMRSHGMCLNIKDVIESAIVNSHHEIISWASSYTSLSPHHLFLAGQSSNKTTVEIVKVLSGYTFVVALRGALECEKLVLFDWLYEKCPKFRHTDVNFGALASGNCLKSLDWLFTKFPFEVFISVFSDIFSSAIFNGRAAVIDWLIEKGFVIDFANFPCTVGYHSIEFVMYLRRKGSQWGLLGDRCIKHNTIDVLKWAVSEGMVLEEDYIYTAVANDQVEMVEYLDSLGFRPSPNCYGRSFRMTALLEKMRSGG